MRVVYTGVSAPSAIHRRSHQFRYSERTTATLDARILDEQDLQRTSCSTRLRYMFVLEIESPEFNVQFLRVFQASALLIFTTPLVIDTF